MHSLILHHLRYYKLAAIESIHCDTNKLELRPKFCIAYLRIQPYRAPINMVIETKIQKVTR